MTEYVTQQACERTSGVPERSIVDTQQLLREGEGYFCEGKYADARACFLRALETEPDHAEALNNLGVIQFHEGQYALAKDSFTKILAIDPAHRDALMNLFDVLSQEGNGAQILPHVERAFAAAQHDGGLNALVKDIRYQVSLSGIRHADSFFVLSCGNSGSETLREVLSTADNARVLDSPQPDLGVAARDAFWNRIDKYEYLSNARYPLIRQTAQEGLVFGEITPAISPFADVLAEAMPKSKFVILTRDPMTFSRSALFKNYYHGHPDDRYRLTPPDDSDVYLQWKKKSQVEKICWLWNESCGLMKRLTDTLAQGRFTVLRFEDLCGDTQTIRGLFDFLNLTGFSATRVSEILERKKNTNRYGRFPGVQDWSPGFRRIIKEACAEHAGAYGYDNTEPVIDEKTSNQMAACGKATPLVTIGLPLYSGGRMLTDFIESILSQDFENFELIISDHGTDPFVREIGSYYQKHDKRVRYIQSGDQINYLGIQNVARLIELSTAPYFMWGSYDDRLEKSFISRCFATIEKDDTIALVYPRSKVFNGDGTYLGLGADTVKADSDDPYDRFIHVIWELQMCNAFYGLFRRNYIRKTRALYKNCYAHDNLFLAEIALMGKIVQIDDALFIRYLTRKYNRSLEEHHADMLRSADPLYLEEGLTLPFCRFTYAHCELVNHSSFPPERKETLTREILRCFKHRWAIQLNHEINRLIRFLNSGVFYYTWDGRTYSHDLMKRMPNIHSFHVTDVLKSIREALFIFPEHRLLRQTFEACLDAFRATDTHTHEPDHQSHREVVP